MGASLGLGVRWDIGRLGQLGLRAREYGTAVIDGIRGQELFGYARAWYEVEAIRDFLGVGMAPKVHASDGQLHAGAYGRSHAALVPALRDATTMRSPPPSL